MHHNNSSSQQGDRNAGGTLAKKVCGLLAFVVGSSSPSTCPALKYEAHFFLGEDPSSTYQGVAAKGHQKPAPLRRNHSDRLTHVVEGGSRTAPKRWYPLSRARSGSFGDCSLVRDETGCLGVIKVGKDGVGDKSVERELEILQRLQNFKGFPQLLDVVTGGFVMQYLGPSLSDLQKFYKRFSLKTVLCIMDQLLCRLEALHSNDFVHGDIKLNNVCIGMEGDENTIYLIDFGLSRMYRDPLSLAAPRMSNRHFGGGNKISFGPWSVLGSPISPRDDLAALMLMCTDLLRSRQSAKRQPREVLTMTPESLAAGLPAEFEEMADYIFNLTQTGVIDYDYLHRCIRSCQKRHHFADDNRMDWSLH